MRSPRALPWDQMRCGVRRARPHIECYLKVRIALASRKWVRQAGETARWCSRTLSSPTVTTHVTEASAVPIRRERVVHSKHMY